LIAEYIRPTPVALGECEQPRPYGAKRDFGVQGYHAARNFDNPSLSISTGGQQCLFAFGNPAIHYEKINLWQLMY
jgi:hypothetical protein